MSLDAIHARGSDEWITPPEIFDPLHAEFQFRIDRAAKNAQMSRLPGYMPDAFKHDVWGASVGWCNPPYSMDGRFIGRAAEAAAQGATTVLLVFAKTDVAWWHDYVMTSAAEVRLIRGRVSFIAGEDMYDKTGKLTVRAGERSGPSPKGSCVIVFRPGHVGPPVFSSVSYPRVK